MNSLNENIKSLLVGGDLRSIGESEKIIKLINSQDDFDVLFSFINNDDRIIVMRAADSIEKITRDKSKYLDKHKQKIIELSNKAINKELKWHLAQIISRLSLTNEEITQVFTILKKWVLDKSESKIVRANSLQTLFETTKAYPNIKSEFNKIIEQIKKENIPSLNARMKKIGL